MAFFLVSLILPGKTTLNNHSFYYFRKKAFVTDKKLSVVVALFKFLYSSIEMNFQRQFMKLKKGGFVLESQFYNY